MSALVHLDACSSILAEGTWAVDRGDLAIVGVALIGLSLLMRITYVRTRRSRSAPMTPAREQYAMAASSKSAVRDAEQVMVELDKLAREFHGALDLRFAKLEAAIRDADERIARLSRLIRASRGSDGVDITVGSGDSEDAPAGPTDDARTPPADARHAEVYRLADDGLSAFEISGRVGRPIGEVELILALRPSRTASAEPVRSSQGE